VALCFSNTSLFLVMWWLWC